MYLTCILVVEYFYLIIYELQGKSVHIRIGHVVRPVMVMRSIAR